MVEETPIIQVHGKVIKKAEVAPPVMLAQPTADDLPSPEQMLSIMKQAMDIVEGAALSPEEQAEMLRQMMQGG